MQAGRNWERSNRNASDRIVENGSRFKIFARKKMKNLFAIFSSKKSKLEILLIKHLTHIQLQNRTQTIEL